MKACYKCVQIPVSWNHYGLSWRLIIRIGYPVNKTYKGSLVFLSYFGIFYTRLPLLWQRFLIQLSLSHTSTWSCFLWLSSIGCMLVLKQDVQTTQLHNVAYYFFFFFFQISVSPPSWNWNSSFYSKSILNSILSMKIFLILQWMFSLFLITDCLLYKFLVWKLAYVVCYFDIYILL